MGFHLSPTRSSSSGTFTQVRCFAHFLLTPRGHSPALHRLYLHQFFFSSVGNLLISKNNSNRKAHILLEMFSIYHSDHPVDMDFFHLAFLSNLKPGTPREENIQRLEMYLQTLPKDCRMEWCCGSSLRDMKLRITLAALTSTRSFRLCRPSISKKQTEVAAREGA